MAPRGGLLATLDCVFRGHEKVARNPLQHVCTIDPIFHCLNFTRCVKKMQNVSAITMHELYIVRSDPIPFTVCAIWREH